MTTRTAADYDNDPRPAIEILRELEPSYFATLDRLMRVCEIEQLQSEYDAAAFDASELMRTGNIDAARELFVQNLNRQRRIREVIAMGPL